MCNCKSCNNNNLDSFPLNKKTSQLNRFPMSKMQSGLSGFNQSNTGSLKNGLVEYRLNRNVSKLQKPY
jgi:hypothetical protein